MMNQQTYKNYNIKLNRTVQSFSVQRSQILKHLIKEQRLSDICNLIGERHENIPKYLNRSLEQSKPSEIGGLS